MNEVLLFPLTSVVPPSIELRISYLTHQLCIGAQWLLPISDRNEMVHLHFLRKRLKAETSLFWSMSLVVAHLTDPQSYCNNYIIKGTGSPLGNQVQVSDITTSIPRGRC